MLKKTEEKLKEKLAKIKEMYLKKIPLGQITTELKIPRTTLGRFIQKQDFYNKEFSNSVTKESLIKNGKLGNNKQAKHFSILEDLSNTKTCYWLGFIAGDGNLSGKRIAIGLASKDFNHLQKLKDFLQIKNKISVYKNTRQTPGGKSPKERESAFFRFTSKSFAEKLKSYGITERKSGTLKILEENLLNSRDFWRGHIDANGWLRFFKMNNGKDETCSIGLCGSFFIIEQFYNFITNFICPIKNKIQAGIGTYLIVINGKNAYKIIHFFYHNSSEYLERKFLIYKQIAENLKEKYDK